MSSETRQQIEDLFAMGFIQESEYRSRLAALGGGATRGVATSRDRLIASFDTMMSGTSGNVSGTRTRTPFVRHAWDEASSDADRVACARCGAPDVPRSIVDTDDHRIVCHADSSANDLLEFPCPLASLGCAATVSSRTWSAHAARECNYAAVVCRGIVVPGHVAYTAGVPWGFSVCQEEHLREPLLAHLAAVHTVMMTRTGEDQRSPALHDAVACPVANCTDRVPLAQLAAHLLTCTHYRVSDHACVASVFGPKIAKRDIVEVGARSVFDMRTVDRVSLRDYWAEFDAESDEETVAECLDGERVEDIPVARQGYLQFMVDFHCSRGEPTAGHVAARVACPLCGRRCGRNRLGRHLINCPQFTVTCTKCHEDVGQRRNIETHQCSGTAGVEHSRALLEQFKAFPKLTKLFENSMRTDAIW